MSDTQNPQTALSPAHAALEERETIAAARTLQAATRDRAEATYWNQAEVTPDTAARAAEGIISTLTQGTRDARAELDRVRTMNENPAQAKARVDQLEDRLRQALVNRGHGVLIRYVDLVEAQKWAGVKMEADRLIRDMPVWLTEPTQEQARRVWDREKWLVTAARGVRLMEGNVAGLPAETVENSYGQDTVKANAREALRTLEHSVTMLKASRQKLEEWRKRAPETVEELEAYTRVCEELADAATDAWMNAQGAEVPLRHQEEQVAYRRWSAARRALRAAREKEEAQAAERVDKLAARYLRHLPDAPTV